jgi:hypothetical protein
MHTMHIAYKEWRLRLYICCNGENFNLQKKITKILGFWENPPVPITYNYNAISMYT